MLGLKEIKRKRVKWQCYDPNAAFLCSLDQYVCAVLKALILWFGLNDLNNSVRNSYIIICWVCWKLRIKIYNIITARGRLLRSSVTMDPPCWRHWRVYARQCCLGHFEGRGRHLTGYRPHVYVQWTPSRCSGTRPHQCCRVGTLLATRCVYIIISLQW